jgi:hypothetical protein
MEVCLVDLRIKVLKFPKTSKSLDSKNGAERNSGKHPGSYKTEICYKRTQNPPNSQRTLP